MRGDCQTSRREAGHDRPRSRASEPEGRRRYDDAVLDEVTRAAVEAFPLLPPSRGLHGSSPSSSGRASRDRDVVAASPAGGVHGGERRRRAPPPADTAVHDVRPWQMSHVRQFDVVDGYPAVHRP